tara:strand:- start:452 stop:682 length:231 start_codon:yes stop_codon:yes gene_type:complete
MEVTVGTKVRLKSPLPYLKTTDPMPMLRPPDLVSMNEIGEIVGLRAIDTVEVRFRRGTFLIPVDKLSIRTLSDKSD